MVNYCLSPLDEPWSHLGHYSGWSSWWSLIEWLRMQATMFKYAPSIRDQLPPKPDFVLPMLAEITWFPLSLFPKTTPPNYKNQLEFAPVMNHEGNLAGYLFRNTSEG